MLSLNRVTRYPNVNLWGLLWKSSPIFQNPLSMTDDFGRQLDDEEEIITTSIAGKMDIYPWTYLSGQKQKLHLYTCTFILGPNPGLYYIYRWSRFHVFVSISYFWQMKKTPSTCRISLYIKLKVRTQRIPWIRWSVGRCAHWGSTKNLMKNVQNEHFQAEYLIKKFHSSLFYIMKFHFTHSSVQNSPFEDLFGTKR